MSAAPWEWRDLRERRVSEAVLAAARDALTEDPVLSAMLDRVMQALDGARGLSDEALYESARRAIRLETRALRPAQRIE